MSKKKTKVITKKKIVKDKQSDKVARVMQEFKDGTLKSSSGEKVTDKKQALAIALSEAGLSKSVFKAFEKADIVHKIKTMKAILDQKIQKEQAASDSIDQKIVGFFIKNPNPPDEKIHGLADSLGLAPDQLEERVYKLLSAFLSGGKSKGLPVKASDNELKAGINTELEHTDNRLIAGKIASDHLAETLNYYEWLAWMEELTKKYDNPLEYVKAMKSGVEKSQPCPPSPNAKQDDEYK